jgi:hypothetical protein
MGDTAANLPTKEPPAGPWPRVYRDGAVEIAEDGRQWLVVSDAERYELPPWQPEDYLAVRREMASLRRAPLDAIRKALEDLKDQPELRKEMLDRAYADIRKEPGLDEVRDSDVVAWMDTRPGGLFCLFVQLSKADPTMTRARAESIFARVSHESYLKAREASARQLLDRLRKRDAAGG